MRIKGRRGPLERRLGAERPQPADEFVSGLARRLTAELLPRRTGWRVALAAGFTVLLAAAFAVTGGISYAASAVQGGTTAVASLVTGPSKPDKPQKPDQPAQANNPSSQSSSADASSQSSSESSGQSADKVTICHVPPGNPDNPQTITIGESAVASHFEEHEGDSLGPCVDDPSPPDDQYADKVLICHIPPGNEENAHIISVSVNAVPAHVAHGDPAPPNLGPCA